MKYYDIMDKEEDGYFISFDNMREAKEWLDSETKRFPQRVTEKGMHIVENERLTIYEKYELMKKQSDYWNDEHSREVEKSKTLKQENDKFKEVLKQVQHDIDGAECRDDLDGIKGYIDEQLTLK